MGDDRKSSKNLKGFLHKVTETMRNNKSISIIIIHDHSWNINFKLELDPEVLTELHHGNKDS